jgi:hypothetical protein
MMIEIQAILTEHLSPAMQALLAANPGLNIAGLRNPAAILGALGGYGSDRGGGGNRPFHETPLTQEQQLQLAFAENKYNRSTIEEQIAVDNRNIARLNRERAAGKIDNLQYVNQITQYLQDRQTMEQRLTTGTRKATSTDLLLARAKNDLQQGFWQEAQRLLHEDLRRLEAMKAEATTSAQRTAIEKQILAVEREINSKAAGYQTSLALQEAEARANALAAANPGLAGPTALQLKLAEQVKAAAMKAIDSGKLTMQGMIDAWNVVAQANSTIAQGFMGHARTYARTSTDAIADSIKGLTAAQEMQLREELAQRDAHRGYRPTGAGAEGYVIPEGNGPHNRWRRRYEYDVARSISSAGYVQRNAVGGINIASAKIEINGIEDPRKILEEVEKLIRRRGGQRTGTRR